MQPRIPNPAKLSIKCKGIDKIINVSDPGRKYFTKDFKKLFWRVPEELMMPHKIKQIKKWRQFITPEKYKSLFYKRNIIMQNYLAYQ